MAARVLNYPTLEIPAKFLKLAAMVAANAARGLKTLVWSNFVRNLDNLATAELAPYNPVVVHGGVPSSSDDNDPRTREFAIRRFRSDPDCMVLLANPAALSEGVSLHHECHDAIYVDRTFNAGQYLQSIDRIHRLGLPIDVETRITLLECVGTVDETVSFRVEQKAERLSVMLTDPSLVTMALPDDELAGEDIDPDDLEALFAHLRR
jgi:SNF2 family DNA or RNA helicase